MGIPILYYNMHFTLGIYNFEYLTIIFKTNNCRSLLYNIICDAENTF